MILCLLSAVSLLMMIEDIESVITTVVVSRYADSGKCFTAFFNLVRMQICVLSKTRDCHQSCCAPLAVRVSRPQWKTISRALVVSPGIMDHLKR
jgi:hypothetical protein